jgi:hypothetical protein
VRVFFIQFSLQGEHIKGGICMYNITSVNLMNATKDKAFDSISDNKKQIHISKDQDGNVEKLSFSMNFWGQGTEKDDLSFFELKMVMNY